jgi:hypothetical protein
VRNSTTITATTPASVTGATPPEFVAGPVDIKVTNPYSETATLFLGFTYTNANPLTVVLSATPPVVDFESQSQLLARPIGGTPPYYFHWSPAAGNIANPVVSAFGTTVYQVSVTDSTSPPNTATGFVTVTLRSPALVACFASSVSFTHGVPVVFNADCSTGPNPILLWEWWFNWDPANLVLDQFGNFLVSPTFTYSSSGVATVHLRVTDSTNATAEFTRFVVVN